MNGESETCNGVWSERRILSRQSQRRSHDTPLQHKRRKVSRRLLLYEVKFCAYAA